MPINIDDTRTLLQAIERTNPPTTTLIDTFFPAVKTFLTNTVDMEYRKGGRRMAPFVVPGSKGVNMSRNGSQIRSYKAPLILSVVVLGKISTALAPRQNVLKNCALMTWQNWWMPASVVRSGWLHSF